MSKDGARFNATRTHRFSLWRGWDDLIPEPWCAFIGLNPSTAGKTVDDPTIRKCRRFSQRWGHGGFYMLNLYTQISTDPKKLVVEPLGVEASVVFRRCIEKSSKIICSWGAFKAAQNGLSRIGHLLPEKTLWCLGTTKDGSPRHPLYIPYSQPLCRYEEKSDG